MPPEVNRPPSIVGTGSNYGGGGMYPVSIEKGVAGVGVALRRYGWGLAGDVSCVLIARYHHATECRSPARTPYTFYIFQRIMEPWAHKILVRAKRILVDSRI